MDRLSLHHLPEESTGRRNAYFLVVLRGSPEPEVAPNQGKDIRKCQNGGASNKIKYARYNRINVQSTDKIIMKMSKYCNTIQQCWLVFLAHLLKSSRNVNLYELWCNIFLQLFLEFYSIASHRIA